MKKESKLFIIPNEDKLETEDVCFERTLGEDDIHLPYIQEFVNQNHLGYHYTEEDSNQAPIDMAYEGHLVIKTDWDFIHMVACYLPPVITSSQQRWFTKNSWRFSTASVICCYSYYLEDPLRKDFDNMTDIFEEIKQKNLMYQMRKDDKNVGKKI